MKPFTRYKKVYNYMIEDESGGWVRYRDIEKYLPRGRDYCMSCNREIPEGDMVCSECKEKLRGYFK